MPNLIKKRRRKGQKSVSGSPPQNATPSASTLASTEKLDATIETIDWALQIANVIKDVSEGSPLLAPVKASCLLIIRGLEVLRNAKRDPSDWNSLVQSLETQKDEMETFAAKLELGDRRCSAAIQSTFQSYLESLREVVIEASKPEEPLKWSRIERFTFMRHMHPVAQEQDAILPLKHRLDAAYQEFVCAAIREISAEVEERDTSAVQIYEDLQRVEEVGKQASTDDEIPYDYDSPSQLLYGLSVQCCEPGTRVALLEDIRRWSEDLSVKEQIYWLKDAAGTGKTTVAATMARNWQADKLLAGRFFFTPNAEISSGINQFCTAVAKDLAAHVPSLKETVTARLSDNSGLHEGFHRQFQRLLVEPLQELNPATPLILVIDALDNCDPIGRQALLKCIMDGVPNMRHVKVLLTSRPNPDIIDILSASSLVRGREVQLLDINDTAFTDIRIYVQNSLSKLTVDEREQLVGYSSGLFIVAATACRMLRRDRYPAKLLTKLLNAKSKDHLDELYLEILQQAMSDPSAHETMMKVLQIIIIAFQPISINTIRAFLPKEVAVGRFVDDLGAVLKDGHPDRPIKVLHPTFREFLAEVDRANGFLVNNLSSHTLTAIGCLSVLDKSLDYDILQLRKPNRLLPRNVDVDDLDAILKTATSAALRYASSYWAYHVAASLDNMEIWLGALQFLNTRLLNWLELMSWRGSLGDCLQGLSQLRRMALRAVRVLENSARPGASAVSQAYRFLLQHQPLIQESALHTYSAALAFTPDSNPLFQKYRREHSHRMPRIITNASTQWSAQSVMTGHTESIRVIEFSPDGTRLASASQDHTLILWDTSSGAIVGHPFNAGPKDTVDSLAFTPDSRRLAFATRYSKIHVWSSTTGHSMSSPIDAGQGHTVQVSFAPAWPLLLSASTEPISSDWGHCNNLRLWNISQGNKVGETMQLDGAAFCFAVSPSGSRVACVSKRRHALDNIGVVTLWSLESFTRLSEYDMPLVYDSFCIRYSPIGDRFATWDELGMLYLRDGINGDKLIDIQAHEKCVQLATFSPDSSTIVILGRGDGTIYLRNTTTGALELSLLGHTDSINYVVFSQDNLRLASISFDQTVRVWNTITGDEMDTIFRGYTGDISRPCLSTDWTKLVTVSISNQIHLHDVDAGTMYGNDIIEEEEINFSRPYVALSPNGDTMVCGYRDIGITCTLDLWSLKTCNRVGQPMIGHEGGITSVAFSHNGRKVASASEDGTVRLWDSATGLPDGDALKLYIGEGGLVAFSPDDKFLATTSFSQAKVWDISTRECIWSMVSRRASYQVVFSSNCNWLAGTFRDRLQIWDFASDAKSPVASSIASVNFDNIAFDPRGEILATSSYGKVQLWKVADDLQLLAEVSVRTNSEYRLDISSDGQFLAYGSSVWNISSPRSPVSLADSEGNRSPIDYNLFRHSLITYNDGWIHSAFPRGPLLPVPHHLWDIFRHWHAFGFKMVVCTHRRLPVVVDLTPLLN